MKIKAAVLHALGLPHPFTESEPVKIEELELEPPRDGEVLVRMAAAGICHSDLSVVEGVRPRPLPIALGHEGAGIVEDVGPGVEDLGKGDHVIFVFMPSCGVCASCKAGRPSICVNGLKANGAGELLGGGKRLKLNGEYVNHQVGVSCFAEAAVADRRSLVKIDPALPFEHAALFSCAVITGVGNVVNVAKVPVGASVAVIGLGGTGLAAMLGARAAGARKVVGLDILGDKCALGLDLGADETFDATDPDVIEKVRRATGGGVEYAFECVGKVEAMELAYAVTGLGGTTVSSGLSHPEHRMALPHMNMVVEERTLKGAFLGGCVPGRDVPHFIDLFQQGRLPVDKLISATIELGDINAAFDRLDAGEVVRQIITF